MAHLPQDEDDPGFSYHDLRDDDGGGRDVRISVADAGAAPGSADEVSPEFPDASQQSTVSASTENWGGSDEDGAGALRRASARHLASDGSAADSGGSARLVRNSGARQRMSIANDPPSFGDYPVKEPPAEMLRVGQNLRKVVSVGSIEPMARRSSSVDWSDEAVSGAATEMDHLSLMDPFYDLTRARLTKLFNFFHPDEDGMVSYEGFRCGLEAMGISTSGDVQFASFVKGVDSDASGGISFNEFLHVIQEIKLAQLFNGAFLREVGLDDVSLRRHHHQRQRLQQRDKLGTLPDDEPLEGSMGSIEYSPDRIRSVYPIRDVERFVYSKKPSWAAVRWIHVEGIDLLLLRRLSVRYRLHPLAVEDALDIDRERPKYEEYDEHASLILQTVHAACDLTMLKTYQRMYRESLYSRADQPSSIDAMCKKELEERLEQLAPGRVMTVPEQLSVYILPTVVISVQEEISKSVWALVKARLDTSYSKVRQHGAAFLVYTIVDACVDELSPIAHTLGAKLAMLERLLRLDSRTFDPNRVAATAKQVKGLKLLCKPLNEVVELLRASLAEKARRESGGNGGGDDIARYLRDVQDHLTAVDEDCERHLDTCRSLAEECRTARDSQHSDVSYVLTLVAALFLPAQFLTGLYGMNFTNMPELEYHYGYFIWWAVVVVIGALIIAYFKFYKKWL